MDLYEGNNAHFYIKKGSSFTPIACLTSHSIDEGVETISTTTRANNGWSTSVPGNQSYSLSIEGFMTNDDFQNQAGNPISYHWLKQMKRDKMLIEWCILTENGRYVDMGSAYITSLSQGAGIDEMISFSASFEGFGRPGTLISSGNRNLLLNALRWNTGNWWSFNGGSIIPDPNYGMLISKQGVTIIENKAAYGTASTSMVHGKTYTLSFDYYGSTRFVISVGGRAYKTINPSVPMSRVSITFVYNDNFNGYLYIDNEHPTHTVYVKNLKLEEGSVATPFSIAPEDIKGGTFISRPVLNNNPDFADTGTSGWGTNGGEFIGRSDGTLMRLTKNQGIYQGFGLIVKDKYYTFKLRYKYVSGDFSLRFGFNNSTQDFAVNKSGEWTELIATFKAPINDDAVVLYNADTALGQLILNKFEVIEGVVTR